MLNSPPMYQSYIGQTLQKIRIQYLGAMIIHYMNDILFAHPQEDMLEE